MSLDKSVQVAIEKMAEQFDLKGFTVKYSEASRELNFKSQFHEARIPLSFVEQNRWADIRQIFRAAFTAAPQVTNFEGQNDWSRSWR